MKPTVAIYGIKDRENSLFPSFVHDHNICVMENGKITQYLQLERYSRKKYDNNIDLFIEDLLENKILKLPAEFDIVFVNAFEANSFISKNGKIKFESSKLFPNPPALIENCFCRFNFKDYNFYEPTSYMLSHELAHIFSALPFYGELKNNSLLIHFDGGASIGNFSAFIYKNDKLDFIEANWNMSHLSKFFNDNALTFAMLGANPGEHTSVPGKLMGFAAFGKTNIELEKWLIINNYFKDIWNDYNIFFKKAKEDFNITISSFDTTNKFLQNIAAAFQSIFEKETILKIKELQKKYNTDYLYYGGGSALNIVTNSILLEENLFKDIFISPACNDSGLSIGAAAFLEWKKYGKVNIHSPYLNNIGCDLFEIKDYDFELIKKTAELLVKNKIIGVCNGFGEVGPRALGNRSILALPNSKSLAKKVSEECKQREWYRPIAPIMLKENAEKVIGQNIHKLSKFMLLDYKILNEYKKDLEGVIHINGTSRIQTLEKREENPFIYDLLKYLWENYKIYGLINTSFNGKGEPIIHTKQDAMNSANNMKLDAIVIDYELIEQENYIIANEFKIRKEMVNISKLIYEKGYNGAIDGNISFKLSDNKILISPSGLHKGFIKEDDFIIIDILGNIIKGKGKISSEYRLHLYIYENRKDINCVIHVHSPYAVALSLSDIDIMKNMFITIAPIPTTEFAFPSSSESYEVLKPFIEKYNWAILKRHGVVAYDKNIWNTFYRIESIENTAKIITIANSIDKNNNIQSLSNETKKRLLMMYGLEEQIIDVIGE